MMILSTHPPMDPRRSASRRLVSWWCALGVMVSANVGGSVRDAAAQHEAPRTLAFVVGVERYDDPELDRLQYAADDAQKVFDQLGVVADRDPGSVLLLADDTAKTRLEAERIRTELQSFVQLIKDGTNVVVYLGGHGTLSQSRQLWYLPSNYSPKARTNYISINEIRQMLVDEIDGKKLADVSLTFLVNMCGAGNAVGGGRTEMSVNDNRELIDIARKVLRERPLGLSRYAVIPATPRERNTFEDDMLRGSVFAHHLREGLGGRAAKDGVVTAGSLFAYLKQQLNEDLPRNEPFGGDIPLGVTRRFEGESAFLVGTALLAAAQALEPTGEDRERTAHRKALLDLAAEQFAQVPRHASDLAGRALLRRTQVDVLRNRAPQVREADDSSLTARGALEPVEAEQLKQLTGPGATPAPRTLRDLREALQRGEPFFAVIIDTPDRPGVVTSTEPGVAAWRGVLEGFRGLQRLETVTLPVESLEFDRAPTLPAALRTTLDGWAAAASKNGKATRLVIVYSGVAGIPSSAGGTRNPFRDADRGVDPTRILPFGKAEIELAIGKWPGPVTVAYLAPYGGLLLSSGPLKRADVSLLLAAQEPNGMTFVSANGSNSLLLARAFDEGVENLSEYAPLVEFSRGMRGSDTFVSGTPRWVPRWGALDETPLAARQLDPLKRFALHVAAGCAVERLDACDGKSDKADPFQALASAAERDLADDPEAAAPGYGAAASGLRTAAAKAGTAPGAAETQTALEALSATIEKRTVRRARRIVVLPLGVEDYASPLVADLPGTRKDLEAYGAAFARAFQKSATPVIVHNVGTPATAEQLLGAIRGARDAVGREDLLVLVYSGRGAEIRGRRYLTTSGTRPCPSEAPPGPAPACVGAWSEVVDVWTLADLLRDHWFIAIYDAQFVAPVYAERDDALLDKHLDSVRPVGEGPRGLDAGSPVGRSASRLQGVSGTRFEALPAAGLPHRQLHIWFEGTVTAAAYPPHACASKELGEIASPFAAAVIAELPPASPGTYREWLQGIAASACFRGDEDDTRPRLVAQGDVDLPLFATGDGAELVAYFRSDDARRHVNLRAADAVAAAALTRFPNDRHRLSRAAILLAAAVVQPPGVRRSDQGEPPWGGVGFPWMETAGRLLDEARATPAEEGKESPLAALVIELLARRQVLRGDPAQGRAALQTAPPALLAERGLAERLVALTDETARQQPATLLEESARLLASAQRELTSRANKEGVSQLEAAQTRVANLLRDEQSRRSAVFTIRPPGPEREP